MKDHTESGCRGTIFLRLSSAAIFLLSQGRCPKWRLLFISWKIPSIVNAYIKGAGEKWGIRVPQPDAQGHTFPSHVSSRVGAALHYWNSPTIFLQRLVQVMMNSTTRIVKTAAIIDAVVVIIIITSQLAEGREIDERGETHFSP